MKNIKTTKIIMIVLIIAGLIVSSITTVKSEKFDQNCYGYLKQTANANTPELALERLNLAIGYIEAHNLTSGYTSILWETEDENIEFWYRNILACREELQNCMNSSQLEKTNVLMKVRESLTDSNGEHTIIIIPKGLYKYPHNGLWAIGELASFLSIIIGVIGLLYIRANKQ